MGRTARAVRRHMSYANVMATLALFIALGGGAYAATTLPHNSVGTRQLRKGAVTFTKIRASTRRRLKGNRGAAGRQGSQGPRGPRGSAGTSLLGASVPSGKTITGAWGGRYIAPQLAFNNSYLISVSFPLRAPAPLDDANVNVAPNTVAGDPDPSCTGSADAPTAPPGKVCIYIGSSNNALVTGFSLIAPGSGTSRDGDEFGFIVRILDDGTVGNTATTSAEGTWAYTAP